MPYFSVHLLEERLAPLVALLVVANQPEFLDVEVVEAPGGLLDVRLVVAGFREGSRLRRGPHRSRRSTCRGAGRLGRSAHQARGRICSRAPWALSAARSLHDR